DVEQQYLPAVRRDADPLAGQRLHGQLGRLLADLIARRGAGTFAGDRRAEQHGTEEHRRASRAAVQRASSSLIHSRRLSVSRASLYSRPLMNRVGVDWIPAVLPSTRSFCTCALVSGESMSCRNLVMSRPVSLAYFSSS